MDGIDIHAYFQPLAFDLVEEFARECMQQRAVLASQEHLPAVSSPQPGQRRFRRPDDIRLPSRDFRRHIPGRLSNIGNFFCAPFPVETRKMDTHQAGKGRIIEFAAGGQLFFVESRVIMLLRLADRVVPGGEGLDDDKPRVVSPSAPSGYLGNNLECALRRPKVGDVQRCVAGNNPDQRYPWKIKPFGDDLRTHKDIDGALGEIGECFFGRAPA